METIAIDLENYYDNEVSIKPLGIDGYLDHPDAALYLISLYAENENGEATLDWSGTPDDPTFPKDRVRGCHAVAHNARFDETDWLVSVLKQILPADCQPARWSCTADLSVFMSGPRSLLGASKELLGLSISKAYRGTALGKNWDDFDDDEKVEVREAGRQDAFTAYQLWKYFSPHWPKKQQKLSELNRRITRRGIAIDEKMLDQAIIDVEHLLWEAGRTIPWEWGGKRSKTPMLRKEIAEECRKLGIPCPTSFAEDSPDAQEWEELYGDTYPWIKALKVWRQGGGFLSKLKHLKNRSVNGIYRYTLKYFGAHTGRFSGDGGFNMQNIYREERFGVNLRHVFVPRPGKKFLIVDYAQIEARILAWVCGMEATLEMVRAGYSIYEVHAINTMGWDPKKGSLKKADLNLYLLAKARVLALGYGCGHEKFQAMAKKLCDLDLDLKLCKKTVKDFRHKNPEITQHWRDSEQEMKACARKVNRRYRKELPSGRVLDYFDVNMSNGLKAKTQRGGPSYHFYGGKQTENEIQAIGLDVMADAMVDCDEQVPEYPIVLDVHDELVFEVPENITEKEIDRVCTIMTTASASWTGDLPLEVEWSLTDRYEK